MNNSSENPDNDRLVSLSEAEESLLIVETLLKEDPTSLGLLQLKNTFLSWKNRPAVNIKEDKERATLFSNLLNAVVSGAVREFLSKISWGSLFQD